MESTLDYLIRNCRALVNDYGYCGTVTREVARRLLAEGKSPYIKEVSEYDKNGRWGKKEFIPVMFKNKWKTSWSCHMVCCAGGLAYEPLLRKPVPVKDYSMLLFGEKIHIHTIIPTRDIRKYVREN